MKLKPAEPILLTPRGCPLAFDVIDVDKPSAGVIGRATFEHWFENAGVIAYTVTVQRGDQCLTGPLYIKALTKS